MAEDFTIKEPHAIVHTDRSRVSMEGFNLTSSNYEYSLSPKEDFDRSKYAQVFNFREKGSHPFQMEYDFDIFIEHGDEALTLFQN